MTKADIITEIVNKTGVEKTAVSVTVETLMKSIKSSLTNGKPVYMRGFGSFIVKRRAAKIGRNISKGTEIQIPEHFIPAFKPAKSFSEKVKKNVSKK